MKVGHVPSAGTALLKNLADVTLQHSTKPVYQKYWTSIFPPKQFVPELKNSTTVCCFVGRDVRVNVDPGEDVIWEHDYTSDFVVAISSKDTTSWPLSHKNHTESVQCDIICAVCGMELVSPWWGICFRFGGWIVRPRVVKLLSVYVRKYSYVRQSEKMGKKMAWSN
jgi:hypothetical protein